MLVHLRSWPRDAMVLAPATDVFGLYGFSGDPAREDQLYQLLDTLAPAYGQDWWFERSIRSRLAKPDAWTWPGR